LPKSSLVERLARYSEGEVSSPCGAISAHQQEMLSLPETTILVVCAGNG
jgi:hypothetical protein